jgi:hypothetical protein
MRIFPKSLFASICVIGSALAAPNAYAQRTLVSTAADGTQANARSTHSALSTNGRYVAFTSYATNLVPGDTNGEPDVFVKDLQTNAIVRVSVATGGAEFPQPSGDDGVDISADGNIIVFASRAPLAPGDTNQCSTANPAPPAGACPDIYVHDRGAGTTTRVSVSTGGTQGDYPSATPKISDDGRYVVFMSNATNLVPGDSNQRADIFLHDRTTQATTRVSVSSAGAQADAQSFAPTISNDGGVIAFISDAHNLTAAPDPWPCQNSCQRPFIHIRATAETTRIDPVNGVPASYPDYRGVSHIALDGIGRIVAMGAYGFPFITRGHLITFDRQTGQSTLFERGYTYVGPLSVSGDGRFVLAPSNLELMNGPIFAIDLRASHREVVGAAVWGVGVWSSISSDGRYVTYMSEAPIPGDTNGQRDIVIYDRDGDGDGMLSLWEQDFGLDPADPTDAAGDPDGDGQTSLQEYQAGTHPKTTHRRYLAEGASNSFFRTTLSIANPHATATNVSMQFLGQNALTTNMARTVPGFGHLELPLEPGMIPSDVFATTIESTLPVAVDRTMSWNWSTGSAYGSHSESAAAAPSTSWFLAEGATHGNFDLFYLLQNPNDASADVTVTYLRENPLAPVVKTYEVKPKARRTIYVDEEGPELSAASVSASITSTQPIMVERAMYSSRPGQPFAAGHVGAGVTAPALKWYLAEGATGSFFDLYLLIANPNTQPSDVTVTYLLPDGQAPIVKTYTAGARSRVTISVDFEDPKLADTPVGMIVESTNGQPIVVERTMWWPSPDWYEAHLVAGSTVTGTRWVLAGGKVSSLPSGARFEETYVLIANTSPTAGTAALKLLRGGGETPLTASIPLAANSRVNVPLGDVFNLGGGSQSVGLLVETDGVEVVVERATYTTVDGVTWSLGTATLATRLP